MSILYISSALNLESSADLLISVYWLNFPNQQQSETRQKTALERIAGSLFHTFLCVCVQEIASKFAKDPVVKRQYIMTSSTTKVVSGDGMSHDLNVPPDSDQIFTFLNVFFTEVVYTFTYIFHCNAEFRAQSIQTW